MEELPAPAMLRSSTTGLTGMSGLLTKMRSMGPTEEVARSGARMSGDRTRLRTSSRQSLDGCSTASTAVTLPEGGSPCKGVRAEFVFVEEGTTSREVFLAGDWNGWSPIVMSKEERGCWSVITSVPVGYREFCYVVDGMWIVSSKHPLTNDGTCNWRTVQGPPRRSNSPHPSQSLGISDASKKMLDDICGVMRIGSGLLYDSDLQMKGNAGTPRPLQYFIVFFGIYFILYCIVNGRHGLIDIL